MRLGIQGVLLATGLLSSPSMAIAAGDVPAETLPSPYFVDGVHCEGLNLRKIEAGWVIPEDAVASATKARDAKVCEDFVGYHGITKLTWITQEDLETFSASLKSSPDLESADVVLKKSQLQNHVHVFVTAKPRQGVRVTVGANASMHGAGQADSARQSTAVSGDVEIRRNAPLAIWHVGVNGEDTNAKDALAVKLNHPTKDLQTLAGERDRRFVNVYGGLEAPAFGVFGMKGHFDEYLNASFAKITRDDGTTSFFSQTKFDLRLMVDEQGSFVGNMQMGPLLTVASGVDRLASASEKDEGDAESGWVVMPGVRFNAMFGREDSGFIRYDISYLGSTKDRHSVTTYNIDMQRTFPRVFGVYVNLGMNERVVQNAVLLQDQFGLPNFTEFDSPLSIGRRFGNAERWHDIRLVVGNELRKSPDAVESVQSPYYGVQYRHESESLVVNLGANYYVRRTY